jgi:hypothetical protein
MERRAQQVEPTRREGTRTPTPAGAVRSFAEVVGGIARTASQRARCHRCESTLRMDAPPTGWVTALAGLLARGS